jgi:vitamin B12 transporter
MKKIIASSILLTGFNTLAFSQDTPVDLPNMVVTATRSETATNQLATAATVYTREDIDRLQVRTLPELLRGSAGLDVTQDGGYGKTSSVFMRGTNSDHVLVLIDGIKVGSATLGTSPFEFVPLDQVERVEITRGPSSSLYGSEAIGGVIQIFTRKGNKGAKDQQNEKPNISLDAGGGSYNSYRIAGNISGKIQNTWYNIGSSSFSSQGFNSQQPTFGPYGVNQPDHDGYNNAAVNARVGHHFDAHNTDIEAFFTRAQGDTRYDGLSQNKTNFIEQVAGTTLSSDIMDNWRTTVRLGQSLDWQTQYAPNTGAFASRFNTSRWNATWLNQFKITDAHELMIGSDYRLDQVNSDTQYDKNSRYDVGVFTQLKSRFWDNHFLNASVRWDENQAFGNAVTGNIGWRDNWQWDKNNTISTFASFGNAFKAPTFNELYYPNFGNANLKAEQSKSVEIGLAGDHHKWLQWELRAYHTTINNLINTVMNPNTFLYSAQNVNKAQIDGLEAGISTQIQGWNSKLNMNVLNPRDKATNLLLPSRTTQTLSFDLSKSFGAFDVGSYIMAQNNRYNDAANTTRVAGYVTVDFRTVYHITNNWQLSAKLNNVLDERYQTVNTYNTAGRNFFISIHYNN